jgi:transcription elongation factor SPT4
MAEEYEYAPADIFNDVKELRACLGCSLVKQYNQFYDKGCDNCTHLDMQELKVRVNECTSAFFEGMIAMVEPNGSWVGRWQQLSSFRPGMYAVQVRGELPKEDVERCKREGYAYRAGQK